MTSAPGWTPLRSLLTWLPLPPYILDGNLLQQSREELRAVGFELAEIDCTEAHDERGLLTLIGGALNFPDYYRPNWDAFDDCIGDLMREGAAPTSLLLTHADKLLVSSAHGFVRAIHLLSSVVEAVQRDQGNFRLEVIVFGTWAS